MKPHGLDLILKEELLENGEVVHSSENFQNSFEAWIGVTNTKNKKYIEFPMRSFVNTFLEKLRYILAGDAYAAAASPAAKEMTKISTCSCASIAVHRAGLVLGTGTTPPSLSDTAIETVASDASLAYTGITYQAPVGVYPTVTTEVRGLVQNNKGSAFYISEVALYGKKNASLAAGGAQMFSRDLVYDATGEVPITFAADTDMRFDFKFKTTMSTTGGLVVNFSKLIYNLFFKGSPTASRITCVNGTQPTYAYATSYTAASTGFTYIKGKATQYFWGIVVGTDMPDSPTLADVQIDTTNFYDFSPDEFTCSANTVSAITSGTGSGESYFTVSRTFTNAGTSSKTLHKVGILCKGTSTGGNHAASAATLNVNQFLIAANIPTGGQVTIQPNQTYRVTYPFKIQV